MRWQTDGLKVPKTAIITGIAGQDGSYLARLLLHKNYRVIGTMRPNAEPDLWRLSELGINNDVEITGLSSGDGRRLVRGLEKLHPDEIYNLGAHSSVRDSFTSSVQSAYSAGMDALRLLEAVRELGGSTRFFQASSSEMFGNSKTSPQNELTPFQPVSPYGASKLTAHVGVGNFRNLHGLHASAGIMFNHESPLRGLEFVTRKTTYTLASIACGADAVLSLGNIGARRDWGYAGDYVHAMWRMLQQDEPDDYVIATGKSHSVRSFAEKAAARLGFDLVWEGGEEKTRGIDRLSGKLLVNIDPALYRPVDLHETVGDAGKASGKLDWTPRVDFEKLVEIMVEADLERARTGKNG